MSKVICIMGESGSGKTTSMRNLDPKTTYYIDADKKGLSWKGWRKQYNKGNKNYLACDDANIVRQYIKRIAESLVLQVRINVLKRSRLPARIRRTSTESTRKISDGQIGHSMETGLAEKDKACRSRQSRSWLLNSLSIHMSRIKDGLAQELVKTLLVLQGINCVSKHLRLIHLA